MVEHRDLELHKLQIALILDMIVCTMLTWLCYA